VRPAVLHARGRELSARDDQVLTRKPFIGSPFPVGRPGLSEYQLCPCSMFYSRLWIFYAYIYSASHERATRREPPQSLDAIDVAKRLQQNLHNFLGAGGGNRTHTLLPEPDFESGASTSSATPAGCK
jgi:hypothetical protein